MEERSLIRKEGCSPGDRPEHANPEQSNSVLLEFHRGEIIIKIELVR